MAKLTAQGEDLRRRISGHIRRLYAKHQFRTRREMAQRLEINEGHFSGLFNGKDDAGLDVLIKLHRAFHESLDVLCDTDPPAEFFPPQGSGPREPRNPRPAPRSARPGGRSGAGGH